jgi:hypothetical protein
MPCQRRRSQGPLEPLAEEGRGENEVVQPVNPAANAAANAPANLQPMPRQTPWPTPLAKSPTTQLMLPTFREMPSQTLDKMQELNLHQYKLTA